MSWPSNDKVLWAKLLRRNTSQRCEFCSRFHRSTPFVSRELYSCIPKSIAQRSPCASSTNEPISICAWFTDAEPAFNPTKIAFGSTQEVRINATGEGPCPTHWFFVGAFIASRFVLVPQTSSAGKIRLRTMPPVLSESSFLCV